MSTAASSRSATPPGVSERALHCDKRWWVVGLLSLGMVIAYTDRVNLTVAMPGIAQAFGLDKEQQGMAMSAFFWTYALFQIPTGLLVDRFGVRTPYMIGFLLWSLASAATTWVRGLWSLLVLRMLIGIGESAVTPSSLRYIQVHFQEKQRGLAVGLYMTGTKIGPAVGLPIAGMLTQAYGWNAMFAIIGLSSLLWLIPWLAWVRKDDPAAIGGSLGARSGTAAQLDWKRIVRSPAMWGIIAGTYCYMYFVYYCMTWMPLYFQERHGMSITKMSWYSGVSFGGMAAVAALAGWAADRMIGWGLDAVAVRRWFTIAGFLAAATQTFAAMTDSEAWMIFFAVFALCGLGLATANYWALTQTLMPGALAVAIQNTAANLAGIVAPWLTGWLVKQTGSYEAPIQTVGVWLLLGIGCYTVLVRRRYAPALEPA